MSLEYLMSLDDKNTHVFSRIMQYQIFIWKNTLVSNITLQKVSTKNTDIYLYVRDCLGKVIRKLIVNI